MKHLTTFLAVIMLLCGTVYTNACTSVIVSGKATANGRPLMWKNRDTSNLDNCLQTFSGNGYSFVALIRSHEHRRSNSVWMGTNEKGFSIMNTLAYNLRDSADNRSGTMNGRVIKRALETCATVADFRNFLDTLSRPTHVCSNYGVIDADGGASYFEVGGYSWKEYDVNDQNVAPNGYLVRTNFSYSGTAGRGLGYPRYQYADEATGKAIKEGAISPRWFFKSLARSFVNPVMGIDLTNSAFCEPNTKGWFSEEDFICGRKSSASMVIEGVKKGDNPDLTTMWVVLGYPAVTPAIPVWVKAAGELPSILLYDDSLHDAPLCYYANKLRETVYSYPVGDNALDYFHWSLLYNISGNGYLQKLDTFEDSLFDKYNGIVTTFYKKGKPDNSKLRQLYQDTEGKIIQFVKGLK